MYKLLIITSYVGLSGVAVHQVIAEYSTDEERQLAIDNIKRNCNNSVLTIKTIEI